MHNHGTREILKRNKLKITPIRIKILDLFLNSDKPLSAENVMKIFVRDKINDVSVYRTLQTFERNNILRYVDLRTGSASYELASHHHHHVVCTSCGVVEDFDLCLVDRVSDKIIANSKKFYNITDHSFELFGLCNKCVTKK